MGRRWIMVELGEHCHTHIIPRLTKVIDGAVNLAGYLVAGVSAVLRLFQTGFVGTYAFFFTLGVAALLLFFVRS